MSTPVTRAAAIRRRFLFTPLVALAAALVAAAPAGAPSSSRVAWITQRSADGPTQRVSLEPYQVVYQAVNGRARRTVVLDRPDSPNVIVRLHGQPLARQRRAGSPSTLAAASARLEAQHGRVRQAVAALVAQGNASVKVRFDYRQTFNGLALTAPPAVVQELRRHPDVADVRTDATVRADLAESVPLIGARELHQQGVTGAGVTVGVIDTGIDYRHPALGGGFGPGFKVAGGYDFVNADNDPFDDNGHGTHVAGIVAADGALRGVAPGATLFAYKVLDATGNGRMSTVIAALERAADPDGDPATNDALDVVNLSLGSSTGDPDDPVSLAVDGAADAGILPVVAAGNMGYGSYSTLGSPAMARRALTVGSTTKRDTLSDFSSRGPANVTHAIKPDVVATGQSIVSTIPGGSTGAKSGTSMAAPHAAGAAALLLQARPTLPPEAVKSLLMTTARDLGLNVFAQGTGRIDVAAAARRATVVDPASVSFGVVDPAKPDFTGSATLTVTNIAAAARRYSAAVVNTGLPAGVTLTVSPSELDLAAGASAVLTVGLRVDASVPPVSAEPFAYSARLRIESGDEGLNVPVTFLKAATLRFTFEGDPPGSLYVSGGGGLWQATNPGGPTFDMRVPPGTYGVYANFWTPIGDGAPGLRSSMVGRTAVTVSTLTPVTMSGTEAVHGLRREPRDERGSPARVTLEQWALQASASGFGLWATFFEVPFRVEHAFSPLDETHTLDWVAQSHPDARTGYSFYWHLNGIDASRALTNAPTDLKRRTFHLDADPGVQEALVMKYDSTFDANGVGGIANGLTLARPFTWTHFAMARPGGRSAIGYFNHEITASAVDYSRRYSSPFFAVDGDETSLHLPALENGRAVHPVLLGRTSETAFHSGVEPFSWSGAFMNGATSIRVTAPYGNFATWLFMGQGADHRGAASFPYVLTRDGAVVRRGTLPNEGGIPPIAVVPGRYTMRIQGPAGSFDGIAASTTVDAQFDTAASDPNPPVTTLFRVLRDGRPTKALCADEKAEIRFRASDDRQLHKVRLLLRVGAKGAWLEQPLVRDGEDYVAHLPSPTRSTIKLCTGPTSPIPVSARVEAFDVQGNTIVSEMTPAYVRVVPQTSPVPIPAPGP